MRSTRNGIHIELRDQQKKEEFLDHLAAYFNKQAEVQKSTRIKANQRRHNKDKLDEEVSDGDMGPFTPTEEVLKAQPNEYGRNQKWDTLKTGLVNNGLSLPMLEVTSYQ